MSIKEYRSSFEIYYIKVVKTLILGSIFIMIVLWFINQNFYFYDYYQNKAIVNEDKELSLVVLNEDIDFISKSSEFIYKFEVISYKIIEVGEVIVQDGNYYREVILSCNYDFASGSIVDIEIERNKSSLWDSFWLVFGGLL